jgi:hypothetical protein
MLIRRETPMQQGELQGHQQIREQAITALFRHFQRYSGDRGGHWATIDSDINIRPSRCTSGETHFDIYSRSSNLPITLSPKEGTGLLSFPNQNIILITSSLDSYE